MEIPLLIVTNNLSENISESPVRDLGLTISLRMVRRGEAELSVVHLVEPSPESTGKARVVTPVPSGINYCENLTFISGVVYLGEQELMRVEGYRTITGARLDSVVLGDGRRIVNRRLLGVEAMFAQAVKDVAEMSEVFLKGTTVDQDIVEVDENVLLQDVPEDVVHRPLKGSGSISEAEWHHRELVVAESRSERGLRLVGCSDADLMLIGTRHGVAVLNRVAVEAAIVDAETESSVRFASKEDGCTPRGVAGFNETLSQELLKLMLEFGGLGDRESVWILVVNTIVRHKLNGVLDVTHRWDAGVRERRWENVVVLSDEVTNCGLQVTWTRNSEQPACIEYLELLILQAWRTDVEGDLLGFLFGSVQPGHRQSIVQELIVPLAQLADDLPLDIVSQSDDSPAPHIEYLKPYGIIDHTFYPKEPEALEGEEEVTEEEGDVDEETLEGSYSEYNEGEQSEEEEELEEEDEEEEAGSEWEDLPEEAARTGTKAEDAEAARRREEIAVEKNQLEITSGASLCINDDPTRDPEPPEPEDGGSATAAPSTSRQRRRESGLWEEGIKADGIGRASVVGWEGKEMLTGRGVSGIEMHSDVEWAGGDRERKGRYSRRGVCQESRACWDRDYEGEWLAGGRNQGRRDRRASDVEWEGDKTNLAGGGKRQGRRDRGCSPTWSGGEGEKILAETSFRRGVGGGAIGTGGGVEPMSREKGKPGRIWAGGERGGDVGIGDAV
ncbi:hypothetical protein CBR_g41110 [Chara braunii]|uniref:Uncharacterized protein n=1 Tax=Chara braunii TaxID=69332 RepID=A0A388LV52_CHABU|nr:hypothetical protein CBR_g41110 [Chara braunii]|eukprot:GBG86206.1 hypothetical protein CBR_g41110 [Chara braunii]